MAIRKKKKQVDPRMTIMLTIRCNKIFPWISCFGSVLVVFGYCLWLDLLAILSDDGCKLCSQSGHLRTVKACSNCVKSVYDLVSFRYVLVSSAWVTGSFLKQKHKAMAGHPTAFHLSYRSFSSLAACSYFQRCLVHPSGELHAPSQVTSSSNPKKMNHFMHAPMTSNDFIHLP